MVGMAIVSAVALVHLVPAVLAGLPAPRIALQLTLWLLLTPVQIAVLSVAFDWAMRRGLGWPRMLATSMLMSAGNETRVFVGTGLAPKGPGVRVPVARERAQQIRDVLLADSTGLRR
jgi:hypothetical protein